MNVTDLGVLREAPCGQELRGLGSVNGAELSGLIVSSPVGAAF